MIEWKIKPTKELNQIERLLLSPVDIRSNYYVWATDGDNVLAYATLINLDAGIVLDLNHVSNNDYRFGIIYRLFGIISRITDPKPTVILNPQTSDRDFYEQLGFVRKGNTYTKTIRL